MKIPQSERAQTDGTEFCRAPARCMEINPPNSSQSKKDLRCILYTASPTSMLASLTQKRNGVGSLELNYFVIVRSFIITLCGVFQILCEQRSCCVHKEKLVHGHRCTCAVLLCHYLPITGTVRDVIPVCLKGGYRQCRKHVTLPESTPY